MIDLKPDEKIECWDIVVTTTDGRKLLFSDLGLTVPNDRRVDELLESSYPCARAICTHNFEDVKNDGVCGNEECKWCGLRQPKE